MNKTRFAPELYIPNATTDINFYINAFDATETRRFSNDDGTIHVSELSIDGNMFHLHEETANQSLFSPAKHKGTTVIVGLFVEDVDLLMNKAEAAGAIVLSPAKDYEYGFRQGIIQDPFGHHWMIQKIIE